MVLLEGKVKRKQCEEELQNIFREELGLENIDIERTHCSKERQAVINQELLFVRQAIIIQELLFINFDLRS